MIPSDPFILLGFVNMKLRDEFSDLEDLCKTLDIDRTVLEEKLGAAGFHYDPSSNQFK